MFVLLWCYYLFGSFALVICWLGGYLMFVVFGFCFLVCLGGLLGFDFLD